ncbi:MAG: methionine--tRNA ligase [Oscillatoria princeps RMCB-10]|jgi:methionyl-tRNA synthetase|nr:methionine--tRNA ligase [Oscillatoria princeps RMCB-10]
MTSTNKSKNTFALTTPLYYVNDVPHIGSAYTTIAADVVARFERLRGKQVLLITGTDEHGLKIQRTAESLGLSPQDHCDTIAASFDGLWDKLDIQYDRFIRTTSPRHQAIVSEFFQRVWDSGDIYSGRQQGWYCVSCEEFKEERDLLDGHRCPLHPNKEAEWRDEQNYFFRLSKYQSQLEALYRERPDFISPESRRNEVLNFVAQGLQDFSISRVNLDWGFPMPADPKHTLYVWFDALLGYVTALLEPDEEPALSTALGTWWPINLHLIGKDILRFHAVYWPAMLMSAGVPVPERVFGHGFLTKDGQKISKTLGNVIDPASLVSRYGSDAVRYYFLKEIEFGKDGDFNETRFVNILNADLANDLGNLLNRTLGMARKYGSGCVPSVAGENIPSDNPLKARGLTLGEEVARAYESLAFSSGCEAILALVRACNKYIDERAPWTLHKQGQQREVEEVLYSVLESVRLAAYLLSPIIPKISTEIYRQLGFKLQPLPQLTEKPQPPAAAGSLDLVALPGAAPSAAPAFEAASPQWELRWSKVLRPFAQAPAYLADALAETKGLLVAVLLLLLAIVPGNALLELARGINDIPLVSPTLEAIGIGYTIWFIYRYALFAAGRQALSGNLQSLKQEFVGGDSPAANIKTPAKALSTDTSPPGEGVSALPPLSAQPNAPDSPHREIDFNDRAAIAVAAPFSTHARWGTLPASQPLGEAKPVFQRLEPVESVSP